MVGPHRLSTDCGSSVVRSEQVRCQRPHTHTYTHKVNASRFLPSYIPRRIWKLWFLVASSLTLYGYCSCLEWQTWTVKMKDRWRSVTLEAGIITIFWNSPSSPFTDGSLAVLLPLPRSWRSCRMCCVMTFRRLADYSVGSFCIWWTHWHSL